MRASEARAEEAAGIERPRSNKSVSILESDHSTSLKSQPRQPVVGIALSTPVVNDDPTVKFTW